MNFIRLIVFIFIRIFREFMYSVCFSSFLGYCCLLNCKIIDFGASLNVKNGMNFDCFGLRYLLGCSMEESIENGKIGFEHSDNYH